MKILKLLLILFLAFAVNYSYAQKDKKAELKAELEKIMREKLRSELNMNESTIDNFISAYNDNKAVMKSLDKEKKSISKSIELDPVNADLDLKMDNIFNLESKMIEQKRKFYTELKTFLTPEEIAKTIILRKNLYKKLRKEIFEHKTDRSTDERPDQNK